MWSGGCRRPLPARSACRSERAPWLASRRRRGGRDLGRPAGHAPARALSAARRRRGRATWRCRPGCERGAGRRPRVRRHAATSRCRVRPGAMLLRFCRAHKADDVVPVWRGFAVPGRAAPARMGQGPARLAARPQACRAGRPCARRRCAAAAPSGRAWPQHSAARPPTSSAGARCEPRPRMLQRGAPGRSQACQSVYWLPGAVFSGLLTCSGRPAAARPPAGRTGGHPCERR